MNKEEERVYEITYQQALKLQNDPSYATRVGRAHDEAMEAVKKLKGEK